MDQKRYFFSFFLFVKILCDSLRLLDSQLFDRLTDAAISSENTQRSEPKSLNVPVVVFIFVCIVVVIYLCCCCPPHLPVLLMFWENFPRCHCQGFDRSWAVLGRRSRCLTVSSLSDIIMIYVTQYIILSISQLFWLQKELQCTTIFCIVIIKHLRMDVAPWCYKWDWIGMGFGWVKYRALALEQMYSAMLIITLIKIIH